MKKSLEYELRKKAGDLNALCGIKDYVFNDGPARGVRAFDLNNGNGVQMTVLADRALDIPYLSFKGHNMGVTSKVGIRSPYLFSEEAGIGFLRQFNAGLMTTGGLTYAGAPDEDGGRMLGLHGIIGNTPADKVGAWADYEGDDKVLRVRGEIREADLFGPNMVLKRLLTLDTEKNVLHIHDVAENQGYTTQPLMLLYHINFGYPMLDVGARVYFSAGQIEARTPFAQEGIDRFDVMEEAGMGRDEQCYFHTDAEPGERFAMIHNEALGIAAAVHYDEHDLPILCQWKCMRAGDYALGLEPTTCGVLSRAETREKGLLRTLEPGESHTFDVTLEFIDDPARIDDLKARATKR